MVQFSIYRWWYLPVEFIDFIELGYHGFAMWSVWIMPRRWNSATGFLEYLLTNQWWIRIWHFHSRSSDLFVSLFASSDQSVHYFNSQISQQWPFWIQTVYVFEVSQDEKTRFCQSSVRTRSQRISDLDEQSVQLLLVFFWWRSPFSFVMLTPCGWILNCWMDVISQVIWLLIRFRVGWFCQLSYFNIVEGSYLVRTPGVLFVTCFTILSDHWRQFGSECHWELYAVCSVGDNLCLVGLPEGHGLTAHCLKLQYGRWYFSLKDSWILSTCGGRIDQKFIIFLRSPRSAPNTHAAISIPSSGFAGCFGDHIHTRRTISWISQWHRFQIEQQYSLQVGLRFRSNCALRSVNIASSEKSEGKDISRCCIRRRLRLEVNTVMRSDSIFRSTWLVRWVNGSVHSDQISLRWSISSDLGSFLIVGSRDLFQLGLHEFPNIQSFYWSIFRTIDGKQSVN